MAYYFDDTNIRRSINNDRNDLDVQTVNDRFETSESFQPTGTLIDIESGPSFHADYSLSGVSNFNNEMVIPNRRVSHDGCNGLNINRGSTINFNVREFSSNAGDGADTPLLDDSDELGTVTLSPLGINSEEDWDHCHPMFPRSAHNAGAYKQLIAAAIMCFLFMTGEAIGGYIAGSLAVMTDGFHLLSDFVGFLISIFAVWLGRRRPTKRLSFGYYRAEVLGALLSIVIIWVMTGMFLYLAIQRIYHGSFDIDADAMMLVAALGIVINIVMGLVLHGACHLPGLSHSHNFSHTAAASSHHHTSINVRAAVIHVLGDFIQSVGVLVAAIIIKFQPGAKLVDPICTLLFSVIVLLTTMRILRDTTNILMEGVPGQMDYTSILKHLCEIEGVQNVHNLHIWCLTVNRNALAAHLAIGAGTNSDVTLKRAQQILKEKFNFNTIIIQVERYDADIAQQCIHCQAVE